MAFDLLEATEQFLCRPRYRGHSEFHLYPSESSVVANNPDGSQEVLGSCLRSSYFRCVGEQAIPHSVRTQGIFELGKHIEDMLVDDWKQMGIFLERGVRFKNTEYNLSGELDVILLDPETNRPFGVEVKSFYGYHAGVEIFGNKSKAGRPKMDHLLQTLVYAKEFKNDLDYFIIYYKERGDGSATTFKVSVVPDELEDGQIVYVPMLDNVADLNFLVDGIYDRYTELQKAVELNQMPDQDFSLYYSNEEVEQRYADKLISKSAYEKFKRVSKRDGSVKYVDKFRPGDWQCSYCKFKDVCWK